MKKYELTDETKVVNGVTLHRIRAVRDIPKHAIKSGDLGGWLETAENLSHDGAAWVMNSAYVMGKARVTDSALVADSASVMDSAYVMGKARVTGKALVADSASVMDSAHVTGKARVTGKALVADSASVMDSAHVMDFARVMGKARVTDSARVMGKALVTDFARVMGKARVTDSARVMGKARVMDASDYITIGAIGSRDDTTTFYRGTDGGIYVSCGCFNGTIDDFATKVKQVHAGTKHERTYLLAIELAKAQINVEGEVNK